MDEFTIYDDKSLRFQGQRRILIHNGDLKRTIIDEVYNTPYLVHPDWGKHVQRPKATLFGVGNKKSDHRICGMNSST